MFRGAGHVSAVEAFAQTGVVGKLHDRQIARHLECEFVVLSPFGLCGLACCRNDVGGHTREFIAGGVQRPLVGGVEHMLAELLGQLGLSLLDRSKPFLGRPLQFSPREHEIAQ